MGKESVRFRGERGDAVIEWPLAMTFLFFGVAALLMILPQWPERQAIARAAAYEAAVTMARSPSERVGAERSAQLIEEAARNHRLRPDELRLHWEGEWCRRCSVTAVVTVVVPAVQMPLIGKVGGFSWTTRRNERIGDYRSIGP
jgi:hypothetical protein